MSTDPSWAVGGATGLLVGMFWVRSCVGGRGREPAKSEVSVTDAGAGAVEDQVRWSGLVAKTRQTQDGSWRAGEGGRTGVEEPRGRRGRGAEIEQSCSVAGGRVCGNDGRGAGLMMMEGLWSGFPARSHKTRALQALE